MTNRIQFQTMAVAVLHSWRLLMVVGGVLGMAFLTEPRPNITRVIGIGMIAAGAFLNLLVMVTNGGRMPANTDSVSAEYDHEYRPMDADTRFAFLGDWIPVREWLISPGDVCLSAGLTVWLASRLFGF